MLINSTKGLALESVSGLSLVPNPPTRSNALSGFDISDIKIEISNSAQLNKRNVIQIGNTQKALPNKILTSLEYVGEI